MQLVNPIEIEFNKLYAEKYSNCGLSNIFIVFICTGKELQENGFYKERVYIARKKKYADIRLCVDYMDFMEADHSQRRYLIWNTISKALNLLVAKNACCRIPELLLDLHSLFFSDATE